MAAFQMSVRQSEGQSWDTVGVCVMQLQCVFPLNNSWLGSFQIASTFPVKCRMLLIFNWQKQAFRIRIWWTPWSKFERRVRTEIVADSTGWGVVSAHHQRLRSASTFYLSYHPSGNGLAPHWQGTLAGLLVEQRCMNQSTDRKTTSVSSSLINITSNCITCLRVRNDIATGQIDFHFSFSKKIYREVRYN